MAGVNSVLRNPLLRGLTGDDRKFTRSRVLLNGQELEDVVAILVASGESLSHSINAASGWSPIGTPGIIEECEGNSIRRISGVSAQTFMKEQAWQTSRRNRSRHYPARHVQIGRNGILSLRTSSHLDSDAGAITMFGSIDQGTPVRVCTATREEIINSVSDALEGLNRGKSGGSRCGHQLCRAQVAAGRPSQ